MKKARTLLLWTLSAGATMTACLFVAVAHAESTIHATNRHAYGANIGWLDARADGTNGASIGPFYCMGFVYSANCGWINLGAGPTNGFRYSNISDKDYGLNHDGAGHLSGYAYGANIGWVRFGTLGDPRINLLTGAMEGFAYGANVGWIGLSNGFTYVQTDRLDAGPDKDGDGLPDAWELATTGSRTNLHGGTADHDNDGRTDTEEYLADTDPLSAASVLRVTALTRAGHTNSVSWTVEPTRFYRLEQTPVLSNGTDWVDSGLGQLSPGPGPIRTGVVTDASASSRFYRVRGVVPLAP